MLILFFTLLTNAYANIEVVSVVGASNYLIDENTIKVFAGTSGADCGEIGNTCNSCTGASNSPAGPESCNENRINDLGGSLTINFSRSGPGTPIVTNNDKSINLLQPSEEMEENNAANYISVRWDVICSYIIGSGNCDSEDTRGTVHVGLDANNDNTLSSDESSVAIQIIVSGMEDVVNVQSGVNGISAFQVYPGDEKIYLLDSETNVYEDLEEGMITLGNFPSYKSITTFTEVRLYYAESSSGCGGINEVDNNSNYVYTKILDLDSEGDFKTDRTFFRDFENEKPYVFRLALVDEAGNVGLFTPNSACNDRYHTATPDDVYGIFGSSNKCFIMETANANISVNVLRKFRDKRLIGSDIGERIIDSYYKHSPFVVGLVRGNKKLKTIIQVLLVPTTIFAFIITYSNFIVCLCIIFFVLFSYKTFFTRIFKIR